MKKLLAFLLMLSLLLTGCAAADQAEDKHPDWDAAWFRVSPDLGVETPVGFDFNENNDVMSPDGLYYATWTAGEGRDITNAQGREATVYDAQIYVLVKECKSAAAAEADVAGWMEREKSSYETGPEQTLAAAGQSFRLLPLERGSEENPYHHGLAAFALRGDTAITVELLCTVDWPGDPQESLEAFLNGFHYGEPS